MKVIIKILKFILRALTTMLIAFLMWWLVIIPIGNNIILNNYAKKLEQFDADSEFEVLEKISTCGKLYGNGNGMEYMVMLLIKSEEELEETSMMGSWEGTWIIRADNEKQLTGLLNTNNSYRTKEMVEALDVLEDFEGYYILYSLHSAEFGSFWNWDIRAH